MTGRRDPRPLVAHVVHRLDVGGLENGVVNLINTLPAERYRHAVVCLTDYTDFARRIRPEDVALRALHKRAGKDLPLYGRLWRCFRELRPDVVHTRNLATLEAQAVAAAAGVRARVHGEHGWDSDDPDGRSPRNRRIRRALRPFVHRYIALSRHIADYLADAIHVPAGRIERIHNGVDSSRFRPGPRPEWLRSVFGSDDVFVFGTVGRLQAVKDQAALLAAFARLRATQPDGAKARLVVVGDGPLAAELAAQRRDLGLEEASWLAGGRDDVPELLQGMDCFVLPSLAEGICNTVLEAMACGRPVIATDVGGNPELVEAERTGTLVPPRDGTALAAAMAGYLAHPVRAAAHGAAGRRRVEERFSLAAMAGDYAGVYDSLLGGPGHAPAGGTPATPVAGRGGQRRD